MGIWITRCFRGAPKPADQELIDTGGGSTNSRSNDQSATSRLSRRPKSSPAGTQGTIGSEKVVEGKTRSWFTRLRQGFKEGRKTEATQVGIQQQTVGTQEPPDAKRLVAMPRFEGRGETNIEGTQLDVAREMMKAKIHVFGITDESQLSHEERALHDKLDRANLRFAPSKEDVAKADTATHGWAKDAADAMGRGALAIAKEVFGWRKASTLRDAVKWYRAGEQGKPADSKEMSHEASLVLDQLTTTAVIERAEWALDIAPMLKNPSGADPEVQELLKTTLNEVKKKALELSEREAVAAKNKALHSLSAMMPKGLQDQMHDDLAELAHRLDLKSPNKSVPDVLGAKVLTEEVKRLFKCNLEEAAKALHDLRHVEPKDFYTLARDLICHPDAGKLTEKGLIANPMLRLVATLSLRASGAAMITALVRPDAKSAEPLRVVLRAVAAYQEQTQKNPAGPGISQAQREWLRSGLDFAAYTLFPSEGGRHQTKDESPAAIRRRRVAYRALQNGFTTNEPGSAYDRVNAFLELARGKELQQTRKRNVRAAAGASGRVRNAMTSGIGDSTQWRKSALKQLSKAATATGLLPTRAEALAALNQTAFDAREALSERHYKAARAGKGDLAPAEKLLLGVLEAADLGAWPPHDIDVKKLKHLKADFFDKAEARLGPEGLNSMDAAFRKEWMQLRTSHPNVGHLFCRLCRKVDMRRIVHPGSTDAPPRSLRERGELWDKRADVAIEAFANLAQVCRSATGGPDARGPAAALAALAEMTAVELKKVSPKAALGALRIDIFENVENALALHQFHTLPKENRSSFQEVRRIVRDSWPSSVRADWDEMKVSGVDVSRLLRNLTDAISRLLGDLPTRNTPSAAASAAEGAAEAKPERIMNCVEAAGVALNALHRDTQVNRFELALCDTITVFNDVRGPTDAAAVLRSLSHRVSLGEKLKATDQQQRGLDVGKIISLPIQFISGMPLTLGLGASIGVETSMDIAMNGAAVQMYLGKGTTRGFNVRAGLGITNVKALPLGPMSLFQAGPRFDVIRADMQQEWARLEGVTLRHIRTSGHEDQLRRSFGDILIDLMDPEAIKTEDGQQYPDRLAALLDRNEFLSVAELVNTRRTSGGELSVGLGGFVGRSMGVGGQSAPYGGLASIGVGLKTQAADMRQVESAAQLSIQEHRLARVSRLELKRGAALPSIIRMTPHTSTFVRAGTFQTRRELLQNGAESLLRIVTKNGETWDTVSHFIQEHELLEDFLESVAGYMHQFCRSAIAKDDVHGAPVGERLGRAWNRISELLDATSKAQRPVDTYTRSLRMRSETAHARDRLEALAEIASDAGMRKEAAEIRASVDELLSHGDAWTAMNMQVRTKGRDEVAQSVMLNIFAGKAVGEATRLHEFLPLGAQNVGRTPNMPVPAPRDDLPPWSPSRQALPSPFTRKEWTERAEDMKQRLQNVQARTTEAEAEKKLLQKQMLTTELAIDGRLKRVRKQRMEVEAAMREELQIAAAVAGDREHPGQLRKASQKLDDAFVKLSRKGSTYAGKLKRFKDLDELVVRLKREEESLTKDISDVLWKAKGAPVRKLPESTTIDQGARAKNAVRMASQGSTGSEVAEKVPFSIPPQSDMEKCGAEEARSTTHDLTEAERVRKGRTSKEAKDSLMKLPTSLPPPPRSGTRRFGAWFESKAHTLSGKLAGFGGASRTTERPARIRKEASTPSELAIEGDPSVTAHGRRQELKSRHRQWKDQTVAATEARRAAAAPIDAHAPEDGNATVEKLAADLNDISRLFERQHGLFDQSGDQMGMEKLIACIPLLSPQPRLKMQTLSGGPLKKRSPKELKGPVVAKHEELAKDLQGRLDKVERLHRELEELSRDFNNGLREIPEVGQVDSAVARLRLKRIKADLEELENSAKQKTSLNDVQGIAAAAVLAFVKHKHVELLRRELDQQAEIIKYAKDNGIRRLDDVQPAFARLKEALGKLKELEMASKESSVAYKELVRRLKGPVETLEDANEWSMSAIRTMAQLVKDPDLMAKLPLLTAQEELAETVSLLTDALMEAERGMRSAENGATKSRKMIDALEMDISWKRGGRL